MVGYRTKSNLWKYMVFPLVVVYYDVNFDFDYREDTEVVRKEVIPVVYKYVQEMVFCISHENDFEEELSLLRLSDSGSDVNVGVFASLRERFILPPTDSFNAKTLLAFRSSKAMLIQEINVLHMKHCEFRVAVAEM